MDEKEFYSKVWAGARRSGKTSALLKRAMETGLPILTHNLRMKSYLGHMAKTLNLENVQFITLEDLKLSRPRKVIVDEVQLVLEHLLKVQVDAVSVTTYQLINLDEQREWREEMDCEHKYFHLETTRQTGSRPSWGISSGQQWKRVDRFFCEKCLEEKEKTKTAEGWEDRPDWW